MCAGIAIGPLQLKIVDDPSLRDTNFPFWATTLLSYVLEVILPPDPNILSALRQENLVVVFCSYSFTSAMASSTYATYPEYLFVETAKGFSKSTPR